MDSSDATSVDSLLVIGNSVRYLAQSAAARGLRVCGIDQFADLDTRDACQVLLQRPSASAILDAVRDAAVPVASAWCYGAGFEGLGGELERIAQRHTLYGNEPRVLRLLADPSRLFELLAMLEIAHPPVQWGRPTTGSWLHKAAARCGGVAVRWADRSRPDDDATGYYQRYLNGPLCSLVFAADGETLRVIGCNRLVARYPAAGDFRFAGVIGGLRVADDQFERMTLVARRLTRALGLRGVNGIDFVLQRGEPVFLELNPRPPASLELYESALEAGGIGTHLRACRGELPAAPAGQLIHGMRVVYARRRTAIGVVAWPEWASDLPAPGQVLAGDAPLCSVHASGRDLESVAALLRQRVDAIDGLVATAREEAA